MRDPVGEREAAAGHEDAPAFREHGRLVGDVEQAFLAEARVEGVRARKGRATASPRTTRHARAEADLAVQARGGGGAPRVQLDADDPAAAARTRGIARARRGRRTRRGRASVGHPGAPGQRIHGADAAVVVLVEVEEVLGGERPRAAARRRTARTCASSIGWRS